LGERREEGRELKYQEDLENELVACG